MRGAAATTVLAAGLALLPGARGAGRPSEVAWRHDVRVATDESVHRDLLALGGTVDVEGTVDGDVVTVDGDVVVHGRVTGDVLAVRGRVRVDGVGAEVGGDALSLFGGVDVGNGGVARGEVRSLVPAASAAPQGTFGVAWSRAGLVLRLLALLFWIVMAIAATFAAPAATVRASSALRRHPWRLLGLGLLVQALLVMALVPCLALVVALVGIPLSVLWLLAWTVLAALALAAVFHAAGDRAADALRGPVTAEHAKVLLGVALFAVLSLVPIVGGVAWLTALTAGSGAVVATRLPRG